VTQSANPTSRYPVATGRSSAFDEAAIARAEAALQSLSGEFSAWMDEEVAKLEAARLEARASGYAPDQLAVLHARAHDVKGLGATYEFPLVTRLAAALCRLLDTPDKRPDRAILATLIEASVSAVKAAVRDDIRSEANPVGRALADELDASVAKALNA